MSDTRIAAVVAAFVVLGLAVLVAHRRWIRSRLFYAAAGAGMILLLWWARMPPQWFAGSAWGFILSFAFIVWSFASRTKEEALFRVPFVLALGGTLLLLNVWAHV